MKVILRKLSSGIRINKNMHSPINNPLIFLCTIISCINKMNAFLLFDFL